MSRVNRLYGSAGASGNQVFEEEDLYSGYNEYPIVLSTEDLDLDEGFQNSARTLAGRRPTALPSRGRTPAGTAVLGLGSNRLGTGSTATSAGFIRQSNSRSGVLTRGGTAHPTTGMGGESGSLNRPMTAVRGAGYTTAAKGQRMFDPLNQGSKSATPSIELKVEDTPEEKIKQLEEKLGKLVEESVLAGCKLDYKKSLDLAKEASNKEKSLIRLKEQAGVHESHDWDITFSVMFNLANQYEACEMYTEALSTYQAIAKNKYLVHGSKVKINIANIYFKQNNPNKAIKMYQMAMDQLANTNHDLRLKIMHNMGIVYIRTGRAGEAASNFEYIMSEKPSFKTGLHLIICNFTIGDQERMKRSFQELLEVPLDIDIDEEKYTTLSDDPVSQLLVETLKNDKLRKLEKERKLYAERCVLSCARLIAPVIENTFADGYNWVTETIKSSKHSTLAHALEISKALVFLKQRELNEAIDILKSFEKKETKVATAAATNLSFMFYLQGNLDEAEKYGNIAKDADFYNSFAITNMGNCMMARGEYEKAKQYYMEALKNDSSCVEALYNLGITSQQLKFYEEALDYFHKVSLLVRNHPHVTYQIGRTHELMGANEICTEWYLKALALAPTDSGILKKLGEVYEFDGDKQQAYQYYFDCFKYDPSDIQVIEWIAGYLKDMQLSERALTFYERGKMLQPDEIRWSMLIASCYRKIGNYTQAVEVYQQLYKKYPENIQVLQNLVKLGKDMGNKGSEQYAEELKKLERNIETRNNNNNSERFNSNSKRTALNISSGLALASLMDGENINSNRSGSKQQTPSPSFRGNGEQLKDGMGSRRNQNSSRASNDDFLEVGGKSFGFDDDESLRQLSSRGQNSSNQNTPRSRGGFQEEDDIDIFEDDDPDLLPIQ